MFFEKPSLRTHVTFEAGMTQLGGHAIWLRPEQVGIGTRETPGDVAANLSRWVDAILARTFSHHLVEELAAVATIPVINGLTDLLHPCQVMADFQTMAELRPLDGSVLAYVGDGNNMANSLLLGAAVLGLELHLATPESHRPALRVRKRAEELAARSGARLLWSEDPVQAVRGSHFVYTDVWTSMGQEAEQQLRRGLFQPFQVNAALLAHAPGGLGAALPAGAPRRGDHGRRAGRPAQRGLRPGREPPARPEGDPGTPAPEVGRRPGSSPAAQSRVADGLLWWRPRFATRRPPRRAVPDGLLGWRPRFAAGRPPRNERSARRAPRVAPSLHGSAACHPGDRARFRDLLIRARF